MGQLRPVFEEWERLAEAVLALGNQGLRSAEAEMEAVSALVGEAVAAPGALRVGGQ